MPNSYTWARKAKITLQKQPDINQLLVDRAREGKVVVRLKGGDPYVFGRGGEEAQELHKAGIRFEVIPGVTSTIAAPTYAGIPVTHRDHASMVTFITGHEDPSKSESAIDWEVLARGPRHAGLSHGSEERPPPDFGIADRKRQACKHSGCSGALGNDSTAVVTGIHAGSDLG